MHKIIAACIALLLVTFGWGNRSVGEQVSAPVGELRIVDKHPLNWASIAFNVFDHLVELNTRGELVPHLATSWRWLNERTLEVTLRQGVTFHNGEVFDAEIVKLNWEENTRLRQPHILGEFMNFKPGSRLEILDSHTVRFIFLDVCFVNSLPVPWERRRPACFRSGLEARAPRRPYTGTGLVKWTSRTGRRSARTAPPYAYRQPPILSRTRLGGEALVNSRWRRPVGYGPI
jgi:hypothetical protein